MDSTLVAPHGLDMNPMTSRTRLAVVCSNKAEKSEALQRVELIVRHALDKLYDADSLSVNEVISKRLAKGAAPQGEWCDAGAGPFD